MTAPTMKRTVRHNAVSRSYLTCPQMQLLKMTGVCLGDSPQWEYRPRIYPVATTYTVIFEVPH